MIPILKTPNLPGRFAGKIGKSVEGAEEENFLRDRLGAKLHKNG
jgi:hypothetical protein